MKKRSILALTLILICVVCSMAACGAATYNVEFVTDTDAVVSAQTVSKGDYLTEPPPPTKDGETFEGWYTDSEFAEGTKWNFSEQTVTGNMTLYAKWSTTKYTITFNSNGGTEVESVVVTTHTKIPKPANPTKTDFDFVGWYKDVAFVSIWDFENDLANKNMTLYARWKTDGSIYSETFKVLSIGNSFSEDAHRYLWSIADSFGVESDNIVVANMYIGGASLSQHVANMKSDSASYQYQLYTSETVQRTSSTKLSTAIKAYDWDVITFQQASHDSGMPDTYTGHVDELVTWAEANKTNPDAIVGWHMTWAYQQTSTHSGFANYDKSQQKMYEAIIGSTQTKVVTNSAIQLVVPSGTAVQNARTSYIGDNLTADGYHLKDPIGRYIAGLMFFKAITGFDLTVDTVPFKPQGVNETEQLLVYEAVNNAFVSPYTVTNSTHTESPTEEPVGANGESYTFDYVQGFWNNNATSVSPESDALHKSFGAVLPISKTKLPIGSEITVAEGYQYRVIYLEKTFDGFKVLLRTNNFTTPYVEIDSEFWGSYEYVAFNISPTGGNQDIRSKLDDVMANFKLYRPQGTTTGHEDKPIAFELGAWVLNNNQINNDEKFISSNPLSKNAFGTDYIVKIADGYKYQIVSLVYEASAYTVVSISEFIKTPTILDDEFFDEHELIAFVITVDGEGQDLSDKISEVSDTLYIGSQDVPHVNSELSFVSGFWADNATAITPGGTAFNNQFIASNIFSRDYFASNANITIEAGYQYRIIFLTYDGKGNYKVVKRTANFTTTTLMDDEFWGDYEYIAFNLASTTASTDISEIIEEVTAKISFKVPHVDKELTFVSGYWNNNATAVTTGDTTFIKGFAASNVISIASLNSPNVTIEAGYQVRVIFFSYDQKGNYKVLLRTDNLTGSIDLDALNTEGYEYVGFNISTNPSTDLSEQLDELVSKITFETGE